MKSVELLRGENPYSTMSGLEKVCRATLEIPTVISSIVRRQFQPHPDKSATESGLTRAIEVLRKEGKIFSFESPRVEEFIAAGYESSVAVCSVGSERWIAKIGHNRSFAAGLLSPKSEVYAHIIRWNYSVLEDVYSKDLPYFLPYPYYVFSPEQINFPTTLQLTPFIEVVSNSRDLTPAQLQHLWNQRMLFNALTNKLFSLYGLLPDLVKPSNIGLRMVNSEPHLILFDMGLFNFQAPVPLLNTLAYSAMIFSTVKNKLPSRRFF